WEAGEGGPSWGLECPLWCVLLKQACQRGKGALCLPADMLSLRLPQLFDIHQVPKGNPWEILRVLKSYKPNEQEQMVQATGF
ncbi:hypothetical protein M9458_031691, partial [Cirrhinus mrigala]